MVNSNFNLVCDRLIEWKNKFDNFDLFLLCPTRSIETTIGPTYNRGIRKVSGNFDKVSVHLTLQDYRPVKTFPPRPVGMRKPFYLVLCPVCLWKPFHQVLWIYGNLPTLSWTPSHLVLWTCGNLSTYFGRPVETFPPISVSFWKPSYLMSDQCLWFRWIFHLGLWAWSNHSIKASGPENTLPPRNLNQRKPLHIDISNW